MKTGILPRIVREIIDSEVEIRERFSRLLKRIGFELSSFHIDSSDCYIVFGIGINDHRGVNRIECVTFSPAPSLHFSGITSLGGDKMDKNLFYHPSSCTIDELVSAVYSRLKSHMAGFRRERVALHYFEKLAKESSVVKGVRISNDEEDKMGVDIVVRVEFDSVVTDVPIQVKSSVREQMNHSTHEKTRGIPSIVVFDRFSYDKLSPQLLQMLEAYVKRGQVNHVGAKSLLGVKP